MLNRFVKSLKTAAINWLAYPELNPPKSTAKPATHTRLTTTAAGQTTSAPHNPAPPQQTQTDTMHKQYLFAMEQSNGMARAKTINFTKGDDGKLMMETVHNMECYAGEKTIKCPITISMPVDEKIYNDPAAKEREIQKRAITAFQQHSAEQDKITEYINAGGQLPPDGITAANLAIKIAREKNIPLTDHKAIVSAITAPRPSF